MLSKSNFMQFLRCACELWLAKQRPDLVPPTDPGLQRLFDEGNIVDAWAQKLYPGGVSVDGFGKAAAEKTRKAIEGGATILLQPTFMAGELTCRCDILVKNEDGSWDIHEVKSSTTPKEEHTFDLAFQRTCLEGAGIRVERTFIVHINNQYVKQGEIDPEQLFARADITHEVLDAQPLAKKEITKALEVLHWDKMPSLDLLSACRNPGECEFLSCYWPEITDKHLYSIAASLPRKQLIAFLERGLLKPEQVPADVMTDMHGVRLPSAESPKPVISIDKKAILSELNDLHFPLYFLDYETVHPAVPTFDGYRPYQQAVFQYSVHVLKAPDAELEHFEFLAEEGGDPAVAVTDSLAAHIGPKGSVIVWNAVFEASRNVELAELVPVHAAFLASVNARMFDLMMIVRKGYYVDSRFGGSASIKKVLPVLCPELSYDALAIHEGETASASWNVLTDPKTPPERKLTLKKDMLAYCGLDTFAMVAIYRKFLEAIQ